MKLFFTILLSISSILAFAQPPNDGCSGAFSVTPDGTCYGPGLPETTTVGSSDEWAGGVGCAGNNAEVWFSFVAVESQLDITVTAGTITGDIEIVLVSSTSSCAGFGLEGTVCGASPLTNTFYGLTPGVTYYYTISSTGTEGTFTSCVNNIAPVPVAGQDCPSAAIICDTTTFTQGTFTGTGIAEEISDSSCFGGDERQSKWYTFTIGCGGTLGFDILPTDLTNDYDFALWNTTNGCYASGTIMPAPVACNWSGTDGATGAAYEYIVDPGPNPCTIAGAEDCSPGNGPSNAGCQACTYTSTILTVSAGETYSLLIDNFGASGSGFTFNFGGSALVGPVADFTMTPTGCGSFVFTKDCQTTNSSFLWSFGDGSTSTLQNPSHTYVASGTYTISFQVTDILGCVKTTSQTVTVGLPPAPAVSGAGTYCETETISLGATATLSGTLNWYDDAGLTNLVNTGATYTPVLAAGTYTFYVNENAGGCISATSSIALTVTTAEDGSFTYGAISYCQDASDPTPTITGVGSGTFTSTAGLSINGGSGLIDVSASTAATYTITYTTPGACPGIETFDVTIVTVDDPTFGYGAATYCQDAVDPTPTATTAGGIYSSTAGLVISSGTGLIDVSASTPNTYTVTYLTGGTCPASSTFPVTIAAVDDPTFSYAASSYCQDASDPTPTITTAGGTFSSTVGLVIDAGTGLIDVSASTAGPYVITYLTGGTCPASSTFNVTIVAIDDPSFNYASASYCQNAADPSANITGTPGGTFSSTAGLTISSGTGLIDVSASTAGSTYTVTYLTGGACPASSTFDVAIVAVDDASFSYDQSNYCQNASDPTPTISGTAGGTFSSTAGLVIDGGSGVIDLSASPVGVYVVTYTTGGACPATSTFNLTVSAVEDGSFTYSSASYCMDGSDPLPTITGVAGGTFTSTAGLSITAGTGRIDLSASTAGTYTVTYITGGTCPGTATFDVTIVAVDDPTFSYASGTYCLTGANPTPTISGTGGGAFSQTGGLVFTAADGTIDLVGSGIGSYTVTYTTTGTCPANSSVSINITNAPDATFSYTGTPYCEGTGSATVTYGVGAGGGDFTSTAGLTINATTGAVNLNTSTPGTYTVTNTIVAAGGCSADVATSDIEIIASDDASFTYSAATYCQDASNPVAVPGGTQTAGGTYAGSSGSVSVNSGDGTIDLMASTAGNYDITYTTSGTCSASNTVNVTITAVQDAGFSYASASYCQAESDPTPTITGASGGAFTSSPAGLVIGAGTGIIDVSASTVGLYDVTYTTLGSCPSSSTVQVEITSNDDPSFTYSAASFCQNASNPLPTITGTTGGTFSALPGLVIDGSTGEIELISSTLGSYDVTYTTGGACSQSTTFSVTISGVQDATFSYANANYCQTGTDPTPTISGTTGGAFTFSPAGLVIAGGTGIIDLSASTIGTYDVTYTTAGTCFATSTVSLTIEAVEDPSFSYSAPSYCQSESNPVATISGTTGGFFSSTAGLTIDGATGEIDMASSTAGSYDVTYLTPGTCSASSLFGVTIIPVDDASFSYASTTICIADANPIATISGTGGGTFTTNGVGIINASTGEIDVIGSGSVTFMAYYTTNGTCPAIDSVEITITDQLNATISQAGPYCAYDASEVLIAATSGGTWLGTGVDAVSGIFNPSIAGAGTFDIVYTLGGNCGDADTIQIVVNAAPVANAGTDVTIVSGESTTLSATGGGIYSWYPVTDLDCPTCQTVVANPTVTTEYNVLVTLNSCVDSSMVTVTVENSANEFFVPNIFSPNGDGNNDVFMVEGSGLNNFNLKVYNRWGEKVFESDAQATGWDGKQNGILLNNGVYVFAVSYTDDEGVEQLQTGNITLIK